jgi:MFS family permease
LTSLLAACFFFSGLTSLICQVAWQRLLTVNYGVGTVSITLIVSVYMSGLGLGSLVGGWLAERSRRPFALFAGIEGGLGIAGGASVPLILALGRLSAESSPAASFIGLLVFLSVPTLLMGITLPLLATIFTRITRDFIYSVSHLYFVNTLGAACGAVLTSYLLVSLVGLDGCIYLAAAINVILAVAILLVRPTERQPAAQGEPADAMSEGPPGLRRLAYALVFATGFVAIGYEIVWHRVIGVLVKDSRTPSRASWPCTCSASRSAAGRCTGTWPETRPPTAAISSILFSSSSG